MNAKVLKLIILRAFLCDSLLIILGFWFIMFDKYIYQGLHFLMKWSGQINSWAWRKHARILRDEQKIAMDKLTRDQENSAYLEELKRKL